jgi:hypothetical protein
LGENLVILIRSEKRVILGSIQSTMYTGDFHLGFLSGAKLSKSQIVLQVLKTYLLLVPVATSFNFLNLGGYKGENHPAGSGSAPSLAEWSHGCVDYCFQTPLRV